MEIKTRVKRPFDDRDRKGARLLINEVNAAQPLDDDGNPTNQLPTGTDLELKESYETVLSPKVTRVHEHACDVALSLEFKTEGEFLWSNATDAQRIAAIAALTA